MRFISVGSKLPTTFFCTLWLFSLHSAPCYYYFLCGWNETMTTAFPCKQLIQAEIIKHEYTIMQMHNFRACKYTYLCLFVSLFTTIKCPMYHVSMCGYHSIVFFVYSAKLEASSRPSVALWNCFSVELRNQNQMFESLYMHTCVYEWNLFFLWFVQSFQVNTIQFISDKHFELIKMRAQLNFEKYAYTNESERRQKIDNRKKRCGIPDMSFTNIALQVHNMCSESNDWWSKTESRL